MKFNQSHCREEIKLRKTVLIFVLKCKSKESRLRDCQHFFVFRPSTIRNIFRSSPADEIKISYKVTFKRTIYVGTLDYIVVTFKLLRVGIEAFPVSASYVCFLFLYTLTVSV